MPTSWTIKHSYKIWPLKKCSDTKWVELGSSHCACAVLMWCQWWYGDLRWRTNDDLKNGGVWPPLKFFVDFIKRIESYYILCLHIACTYVCGCSIAYTSYSNSLLFSKPKIFGERLTLTILHMVHIRVRNPIFKVRYVWPWFLSCFGALVCF